jgi:hypothetical protein
LYTDMNILKEAQECSERIYRYGYLEKEEYSRLKDRVYHFYNLNFGGLL